jgi:hypothetical protein
MPMLLLNCLPSRGFQFFQIITITRIAIFLEVSISHQTGLSFHFQCLFITVQFSDDNDGFDDEATLKCNNLNPGPGGTTIE